MGAVQRIVSELASALLHQPTIWGFKRAVCDFAHATESWDAAFCADSRPGKNEDAVSWRNGKHRKKREN
jgi:hypothetical protein